MVRVTLWEASLAFVLVCAVLVFSGTPWPLALLLAVVAMETAPATTLMVLNEYDAKGPMTDRLLALVALNNVYVLVMFGVVTAALTLVQGRWRLVTAAYRGAARPAVDHRRLGCPRRAARPGDGLLGVAGEGVRRSHDLSIGAVLIAVGASRWLGLSPLFATLALGATVANASAARRSSAAGAGTRRSALYAAFFVIAGAELVPSSCSGSGWPGCGYTWRAPSEKSSGPASACVGRTSRRWSGSQLGYCLVSSSSLAVGLTIQIRSAFPTYAASVTGIVLAAVVLFEIVGPLLTRRALFLTGEAKTVPAPLRPSSSDEIV